MNSLNKTAGIQSISEKQGVKLAASTHYKHQQKVRSWSHIYINYLFTILLFVTINQFQQVSWPSGQCQLWSKRGVWDTVTGTMLDKNQYCSFSILYLQLSLYLIQGFPNKGRDDLSSLTSVSNMLIDKVTFEMSLVGHMGVAM